MYAFGLGSDDPSHLLQVACSAQGLTVFVQDRSFLCVRRGQLLSVSVRVSSWVYNGVLVCPACSDFCDDCPLPHLLPPFNTSRSSPIGQCNAAFSLSHAGGGTNSLLTISHWVVAH